MKRMLILKTMLLVGLLFNCISCKEVEKGKMIEVESPKRKGDFKFTTKKLMGTWRSTDDSLATVTFTSTNKIQRYNGDLIITNPFSLGASCNQEEQFSKANSRILYILEAEDCWSINTLNKANLELTFMARGNTLSYKRID